MCLCVPMRKSTCLCVFVCACMLHARAYASMLARVSACVRDARAYTPARPYRPLACTHALALAHSQVFAHFVVELLFFAMSALVRPGSKGDSLPAEVMKGAAPTIKNKVKALSDSKMTKRVLMGMSLKVNFAMSTPR